MKRLILIRHGKSSWDDPLLDDHDRPLNKRGQNAATAMGHYLRTNGYTADQAFVSTARRTVETCQRLKIAKQVEYINGLYHAGAFKMLDVLHNATVDRVLMIGHNPGIAEFAHDLMAERPNHDRFYDYPTCATLVIDFPVDDWRHVKSGTGQFLTFLTPHDLK